MTDTVTKAESSASRTPRTDAECEKTCGDYYLDGYVDSDLARDLELEAADLRDLRDRLKLEAQIHAQEARTANATIAEIYQIVTGKTGEPGNWHGAEPVRECIKDLRERLAIYESDAPEGRKVTNAQFVEMRERLAKAREEAIEECAKAADRVWQEANALRDSKLAGEIARSIRALSQKGADHE